MMALRSTLQRIVWSAALACSLFGASTASAAPDSAEQFFPPWSHGANDPVKNRGLEFTVPEVDNLPDFHGDPMTAKLVVFVGGNYFFAMAPLVVEFERQHPQLHGQIYYETIPPGLLVEQIKNNGTITVGNMTWTVHADVYAAGQDQVEGLIDEGYAGGPAVPYVTNTLTIMIPRDNPAHIRALTDLGKPGVRLVMPNPAFEGIGHQIQQSLAKAGGEALVKIVYDSKVHSGETYLTRVHHRQSPLYLMLGRADAGITWQSEAVFQREVGNPIGQVSIPEDQNVTASYAAALLKAAPHPQAGQQWVDFLRSPNALAIFEHYGFKPYVDKN